MNDSQPGWVKCELVDIWGQAHTFVDKMPVFSTADLDARSAYPQSGAIRCKVAREWRDAQGREVSTVDTEALDNVAAISGETRFDVSPEQLLAGE